MLKYLGLMLLAVSGIFISSEYEKKEKKRLFELAEFIRLIEHIRLKISCFLAPKSDWLSDFKTDSETVSKFLLLAENKTLRESFSAVRDKLSLLEESEVFLRLFTSLGKAYKDSEIELLDQALSELYELKKRTFSESPKNVKTFKVIATAIAVGLIILLV